MKKWKVAYVLIAIISFSLVFYLGEPVEQTPSEQPQEKPREQEQVEAQTIPSEDSQNELAEEQIWPEIGERERQAAALMQELAELQAGEQTVEAQERIQEIEQELQQLQELEQLSTAQIDFKYPNGSNYGTYNTPDIADDVGLLPYDFVDYFAEKRRTAYLNIHPHNYINKPEPLRKVPNELVESIDDRVKTIDPTSPEAILQVAGIVQEEVLNFGDRFQELFPDYPSFNCVPRSIYTWAMLSKEIEELGLNAQSGLHEAAMDSTSNTIDHQDVWLYDRNQRQLYIVYTTTTPSGISKWEDNILHQFKGYVSGLNYEKMKAVFGSAMAKRSLLFSLVSAIDIEVAEMAIFYVTMTESDAKQWVSHFMTNGIDGELFEILWKIISVCESPQFQESNLSGGGHVLAWIGGVKKHPGWIVIIPKKPRGLVVIGDSYTMTEDLDYWLQVACEGDPDEIARIEEQGQIVQNP